MKESLQKRNDVLLRGFTELFEVQKYLEQYQKVPYEVEDCLEWLSNEMFKVTEIMSHGITHVGE